MEKVRANPLIFSLQPLHDLSVGIDSDNLEALPIDLQPALTIEEEMIPIYASLHSMIKSEPLGNLDQTWYRIEKPHLIRLL